LKKCLVVMLLCFMVVSMFSAANAAGIESDPYLTAWTGSSEIVNFLPRGKMGEYHCLIGDVVFVEFVIPNGEDFENTSINLIQDRPIIKTIDTFQGKYKYTGYQAQREGRCLFNGLLFQDLNGQSYPLHNAESLLMVVHKKTMIAESSRTPLSPYFDFEITMFVQNISKEKQTNIRIQSAIKPGIVEMTTWSNESFARTNVSSIDAAQREPVYILGSTQIMCSGQTWQATEQNPFYGAVRMDFLDPGQKIGIKFKIKYCKPSFIP
jgi:hypothetical protein